MGNLAEVAADLAETGRCMHARGWAMGTAGNYSAVLSRSPLQLAISPRGLDKGSLTPEQFLTVDEAGRATGGAGQPSEETALHLAIVAERGAGAVLHTHSVWNTLLSELCAEAGGVEIAGFEMLKGLEGVSTHEHVEWVPVLSNTQDYPELAREVTAALRTEPRAHGLLLRGHGLYSWGRDLKQARRHVEVLEFLFEVVGRLRGTERRARRPVQRKGGANGRR